MSEFLLWWKLVATLAPDTAIYVNTNTNQTFVWIGQRPATAVE